MPRPTGREACRTPYTKRSTQATKDDGLCHTPLARPERRTQKVPQARMPAPLFFVAGTGLLVDIMREAGRSLPGKFAGVCQRALARLCSEFGIARQRAHCPGEFHGIVGVQ